MGFLLIQSWQYLPFCPVINLYSLLFYTKQSIRIFVHVTDALVWIAIICGQSFLINIPVWFHNGFISESLTASSEQHAFVILLLLLHLLWDCVSVSSKYIIIPSPRRISLLLRASPPICLSWWADWGNRVEQMLLNATSVRIPILRVLMRRPPCY